MAERHDERELTRAEVMQVNDAQNQLFDWHMRHNTAPTPEVYALFQQLDAWLRAAVERQREAVRHG